MEQEVNRLEKEHQGAKPDEEIGVVKRRRVNWYKTVRNEIWSGLTEAEQEQQTKKKKAEERGQVPTDL